MVPGGLGSNIFFFYFSVSSLFTKFILGSFWTGAICSNLAWLTIWPLDVIKSQVQSGNFKDKSTLQLLIHLSQMGHLYRGLVPGLCRSAIANGCSMVAYDKAVKYLQQFEFLR